MRALETILYTGQGRERPKVDVRLDDHLYETIAPLCRRTYTHAQSLFTSLYSHSIAHCRRRPK